MSDTGEAAWAGVPAFGTTALIGVTDPNQLASAQQILCATVETLSRACGADSELRRVNARTGERTPVGPVLASAVREALRVAEATDGVLDPTIPDPARTVGGWRQVQLDPRGRWLLLPRGVRLDLGATVQALAVDWAAAAVADLTDCGALVGIGQEWAAAGAAPANGWAVPVHAGPGRPDAAGDGDLLPRLTGGGMATAVATSDHHDRAWQLVSVLAPSCLDAKAAAAVAIELGDSATAWLARHDRPARLVTRDGRVVTISAWPASPESRFAELEAGTVTTA